MLKKLETLKEEFLNKLNTINSFNTLEALEKEYLGKKGKLNILLKGIKDLSIEERKIVGQKANDLKDFFIESIFSKKTQIEENEFYKIKDKESIDVTLTFPSKNLGHFHPITIVKRQIIEIFISMGFKIEDGPQIENEDYNFTKLNIPDNHPARDVWDTFWLNDNINKNKKTGEKLLLRTHTSPIQIRTMLKNKLPLKVITPGRVFRYEQEDSRHTANFYQLEGFVVGENINFGQLKWTLNMVMKKLLGEDIKLRFRPSIFPFTEPSAEIDISCQLCKQKDKKCKMCSGTGWVELLGAGMIHPKVLENCGIDPEKYSGFAFGIGIDRIATQKFSIEDGRMLYEGNLKLNEQF